MQLSLLRSVILNAAARHLATSPRGGCRTDMVSRDTASSKRETNVRVRLSNTYPRGSAHKMKDISQASCFGLGYPQGLIIEKGHLTPFGVAWSFWANNARRHEHRLQLRFLLKCGQVWHLVPGPGCGSRGGDRGEDEIELIWGGEPGKGG